jgi:hypothetical protein
MTNETKYKVKHTHGLTETFSTLEEALESFKEIYGADIETGGEIELGRVLVWRNYTDAEFAEDTSLGSVASIKEVLS